MPVSYVIDKDRHLVITNGVGRVTFNELRINQGQLATNSEFNPEFDQIIDFTGVTSLEMTPAEARALATIRLFKPYSRRALVAGTPAMFVIGLVMQAKNRFSEASTQTAVFYELAPALRWLGLTTN